MSGAADQRPLLRVSGAAGEGCALPEKGTLVVGSSAERAGFLVEGPDVDDAHCAVGRLKDGRWAIKDLGSRAGTSVNGKRVTSARIDVGDVIELGARRLEVVASGSRNEEAGPQAPAAPVAPGPSLGRLGGYRLERQLGRGSMGLVYLAEQESLHRPVALKVLTPKLAADRDFVARFQSEARAAAALSHPNVVVVYDVGESDGKHFLSMEFMAGGSLEDRIAASGPLPWREALDVLTDAARGLTYAEERGIVHRDIKPANLMVAGNGSAKIADLGLATSVESEEAEGGKRIYGTPHFISPEQARGEPADHRSDLYSLGATAYRVLTGHTPFEGESTREILIGHFTRDAAPPSARVAGIPPGLDAVVLRLLAKTPAERLPSAQVLVTELERLRLEADHGSLAARRPSRLPWLAAAVVIVAGLGGWALTRGGAAEGEAAATSRAPAPVDRDAAEPDEDAFLGAGEPEPAESVDEERALELLELQAELALSRIPPELEGEDRVAALRAVADEFGPTTAATRARVEITTLRESLTSDRTEEARLEGLVSGAAEGLRGAALWPPPAGELPRPLESLARLRAHEPPAEIAGHPRLLELRRSLEQEILERSETALRGALSRAAELESAGDFEAARASIEDVSLRLDPEALSGEEAELSGLRTLGAEVAELLAGTDVRRATWRAERIRGDRRQLARALGPGSGFRELGDALDLPGIDERLVALSTELATDAGAELAARLSAELARARAALTGLVDEYRKGGWRRSKVPDPEGRRSGSSEVVGVNAGGLVLERGGRDEPVPWSAFGHDPDAIYKLFHQRIERAYTDEERRGVATLLRTTGTLRATALAAPALAGEGALSPEELAAIRDALRPAEEWLSAYDEDGRLTEERARLAREVAALDLLLDALGAVQREAWSEAASTLERLLATHDDTWTVLLTSDGTPTAEPAAAAVETSGAPAAGGSGPPGDEGAGGSGSGGG